MRAFERMIRRIFGTRSRPSADSLDDNQPIHAEVASNIAYLSAVFADASDFVIREIPSPDGKVAAAVAYMKGLTDVEAVRQSIVQPLQQRLQTGDSTGSNWLTVQTAELGEVDNLGQIVTGILRGKAAVILHKHTEALLAPVSKKNIRAIQEPESEKTITGPKEGFVESLEENVALVRRRLLTPTFKSRIRKLGTLSQTAVAVCYLDGLVDGDLLEEVYSRLDTVASKQLPILLDASYLLEAIEDHPLAGFPQIMTTERPDRVVGNLAEGRVALMVDGTPSVLILPAALPDFFQTPEDYYLRPMATIVARLLRYTGAFLATTLTSLYVAVLTFHYEVVPSRLLVAVASSRSIVPFPIVLEALALEFSVELLREATNRLPTIVGQVIGVVGALVLGQAAVEANLVSPLLVVVVAISTVSAFAIPSNPHATAFRLLRFPLVTAAGFL